MKLYGTISVGTQLSGTIKTGGGSISPAPAQQSDHYFAKITNSNYTVTEVLTKQIEEVTDDA